MKVSLKNMQGRIQKSAEVFSNDPKNPKVSLRMAGNVKPLITATPGTMVILQGMADQIKETTVDLVTNSQPFKIHKMESQNLDDKVSYELETVEEGKHYRLKINNKVKTGRYNGFIRLLTDHPQKPEVIIRVNANVTGVITVNPPGINVGKLNPGAGQAVRKGTVVVYSNVKQPFEITKLTYDEQLISISRKPIEGKHGYSLEISPKLENVPQGDMKTTSLSIETDAAPDEKHTVQIHVTNR